MNIVQRVQDILLKPKATWPVIEAEAGDTASIYKNYLVILAAIPAVAGFIGMSLIGVGAFGVSVRVPLVAGLVHMVVGYVLSLVMVFVLSLVVDALAPTFGGTKNKLNAFKLVAYASTAGFLGGIFSLLPSLAILGLLAALYAIYLIYTGLPVLMKNPEDKSIAYTAVIIVCGIVAAVILGAITALVTPSGAGMRIGGVASSDAVTITTPGGGTIDTSKMEAIAKKMEQAQASGDTAAAGKAAAEMLGSLTGASGVPIAAADLKALLPESIGDLKRDSVEAQSNAALGIANSSAKAGYTNGSKRMELSITDIGGASGLMMVAGWANMTMEKDANGRVEKVYKEGKRTVREEYNKDGSHGEYTVVLENGVIVAASGASDIGALKSAVTGVNLGKLESTQRAAKS